MPYVRFYMSDWLSATRGMKANEIGVYFTMLALMYERGEPLPEDYTRLSRQCGCTPKTCETIVGVLMQEGKVYRTEDGLWNKRVQKEFDFRGENSKTLSNAAKKRWEKDSKNNGSKMHGQSQSNAKAMPKPEARNQNTLPEGSLSPADEAFAEFCEVAGRAGFNLPKLLTKDRRVKVNARLAEHGRDGWSEACRKMAASRFCRGENDRGWKADLDFVLQPKSFNGLLEGKYDDTKPAAREPPKSAFQLHNEAVDRELDKVINGKRDNDDSPSNIIDLAAADYRHR